MSSRVDSSIFFSIGGARSYAEAEFWFALIKILTIIGLIIAGLVITSGGGPDGQSIGFRYWRNPGPFAQFHDIEGSLGRFLGTWSVLSTFIPLSTSCAG